MAPIRAHCLDCRAGRAGEGRAGLSLSDLTVQDLAKPWRAAPTEAQVEAARRPAEWRKHECAFSVRITGAAVPGAASKAADLGGGRPLPSIAHSDG